jgi:steroid 5-alpha reductase family enzyme
VLVAVWGVRLTYNFLRGWGGLSHEDWRYRDFRGSWGRWYWPGSLFGIHLFPTLMTWLGCLALVPAMRSSAPLGLLDVAAVVVTVLAIAIEAIADEQLLAFRRVHPQGGAICEVGLWGRSRHPNYLGEVMFWVGLWLFAVAADPGTAGWTAVGPIAMVVMFRGASIPLADRRSLRRRPGYAEHMRRVPALLLRLW